MTLTIGRREVAIADRSTLLFCGTKGGGGLHVYLARDTVRRAFIDRWKEGGMTTLRIGPLMIEAGR